MNAIEHQIYFGRRNGFGDGIKVGDEIAVLVDHLPITDDGGENFGDAWCKPYFARCRITHEGSIINHNSYVVYDAIEIGRLDETPERYHVSEGCRYLSVAESA